MTVDASVVVGKRGDTSELGRRFVDCFVRAADDAELPGDPEFRAELRAYMQWAVDEVLSYPEREAVVPVALTMPRWSWGGLQDGDGSSAGQALRG